MRRNQITESFSKFLLTARKNLGIKEKKKEILIKIFLVFLGVGSSLILVVSVSKASGQNIILRFNCFQSDRILEHKHLPNSTCQLKSARWETTYKINSLGLRDREYNLEKAKNSYRILVLGDSFTEGWGVDVETAYPKVLEKELQNKFPEKNIEVINAGIASYSPILEYLYLKNEGLKFSPDLVIVAIDNTDFKDDLEYYKNAEFDSKGNPVSVRKTITTSIKDYLNYLDSLKVSNNDVDPKLTYDVSKLFSPTGEMVSKVKNSLTLISEITAQNSTELLLITYPYKRQVKDNNFSTQNEIMLFAQSKKIKYFDASSYFKDKINIESEYLPYDIHLSATGHKTLGDALTNYLMDNFTSISKQ